jgi:hypothetical protein
MRPDVNKSNGLLVLFTFVLLGLILAMTGCAEQTPQYGVEQQIGFPKRQGEIWAVAPAINLSGYGGIDPLLQADLLYGQLQQVRGLTVIPLPSDRLVLICPPAHTLAGRKKIRAMELQGQDFVLFERDIPTRRATDRILKSHSVTVRRVAEMPAGSTVNICGEGAPAGWVTTAISSQYCGKIANTSYIARTIRKIEGLSKGSEVKICGDAVPPGWVSVGDNNTCARVAMTSYLGRTIRNVSGPSQAKGAASMSAASTATFSVYPRFAIAPAEIRSTGGFSNTVAVRCGQCATSAHA